MEQELVSGGLGADRVVQQFKQVIRTYMLRMLALSQQSSKFNLMHPLQELDVYYSKLLHVHDIKESHIYELTNCDIKSDQHCLLLMTLLYDLAKWVIDTIGDASAVSRYTNYHNTSGYFSMRDLYYCAIQPTTVECIINQSMAITKSEKKHQTLISKNNELIRILMQLIPVYLPIAIVKSQHHSNCNPESMTDHHHQTGTSNNSEAVVRLYSHYTRLYDMMKANKDSNNSLAREDLKKNYNRAVQASIKSLGNIVTLVILQTPPQQHLQIKPMKIPHIQLLLQMMQQILKYLDFMYSKVVQELYCVIEILNTVVLNNATNIGSLNINSTVIPKQQVNGFSAEVSIVYGNNFAQVLLSRLKILRLILDVVGVISSMDLVKTLLHHTKDTNNKHNAQAIDLVNKLEYNQHILHKSAHILIQVNGYVKNSNYYLLGMVFSIYEKMMKLLLNRNTVVPLYLYTHVVIGNLKLVMEWSHCTISFHKPTTLPNNTNTPGILLIPNLHVHLSAYMGSLLQAQPQQFSQLVLLQTILTQISNIFNPKQLEYFLKLYDWNFMEEDICLTSIKYLYQFIENSDNQVKPEYELFKKCLANINKKIEVFLQANSSAINSQKLIQPQPQKKEEKFSASVFVAAKKQRKQFYDLKKKQYLQIVQKINKKPKDIFKIIREFNTNGQKQMKDDYIQKCVRIIKKSNHIEQRAMLDFMGANTSESEQLLQKYIETFFKPNIQKNTTPVNSSVEHFLRYIISNFFLAGEAQQIVRFIDKVTLQYFRHQTGTSNLFKNSDSVYTFANAIILLNADQHNPKNPNRMSLQSFMKMCEKINAGEPLPAEVIKQTYHNIRESQIHTFRNRFNIQKISLECWLDMVNEYETVGIDYYDEQMVELCTQGEDSNHNSIGFKEFANELLLSVIDEKQTQKLEAMIERFEYDDRKFDCQIIEKIRQMIVNKKHIAMHALQKIYEEADFRNKKLDEKMLSYCWLACGIIETFPQALPLSKIAQYLIRTWKVGFEVKDNLLIRQNLQLKTIKKCIKQHKKKESKKSIMEMFSKFLSSKESQNQDEPEVQSPLLNNSNSRKKANVANCSFNVLKLLMKTKESRARAAQAILFSLRHEESRRFQEFVACLYLIFHFVFGDGNFENDLREQNSENTINMDCLKILLNLLDDFYCITEPHQIGSRITTLKAKNFSKYQLVYAYAQFWTLKILLGYSAHYFKIKSQEKPAHEQKIKVILGKSEDLLSIINAELLQQIVDIVDLEGLTFEELPQKLHIPKELSKLLRLAVKSHGLQPKYLSVNDPQTQQPGTVPLKKSESIEKKQPTQENQKPPQKIQQSKQIQKPKASESTVEVVLKKQIEQSIEQAMKKQLGITLEEKKQIINTLESIQCVEKDEQKQTPCPTEIKLQNQQKSESIRDEVEKQENLNIGGGQDKFEEQKKSVKSSESGQEIGIPIYML